MSKGFNKDGFMSFLEKSFFGFNNSFLRETVENLIDYALKHENHSLDQVCYFLSDMLPEVEFAEVAMFMDDSMLTAHGREVKQEILAEMDDAASEAPASLEEAAGLGDLDKLLSAASKMRESEIPAVKEQIGLVFLNDIEDSVAER